jgi:hypothetical protein
VPVVYNNFRDLSLKTGMNLNHLYWSGQVGTLCFCGVLPCLFIEFCNVVRGASQNQAKLDAAEMRATYEVLASDGDEHTGVSTATARYRASQNNLQLMICTAGTF